MGCARSTAFIAVGLCVGLGGCATKRPVASPASATVEPTAPDPDSWRAVATLTDVDRVQRIDAAWLMALGAARGRNGAAIAREGPLLASGAALPRAALPPGRYRCRVVALGRGAAPRGRTFAAFKPFTCFVQAEEKLLVLMKATGTQLPGGRLWQDGDTRMVFLGAMAPRAGAAAPSYGADPRRDRAGVVERVGEFRWRLVMPWLRQGPVIEVMELVPEVPPATVPTR